MRILRIDSWDGEEGGGAQAYVRTVSAELERRGHPNRIVSLTNASPARAVPGETRISAPTDRFARAEYDLTVRPKIEQALRSAIAEFRPEIIHLHHFDAGFESIAYALRSVEVPVVFTAHDAELVCPISTLVRPGNVICEGGVRVRCLFTGCQVGLGGPFNLWQSAVFEREVAPKVRAYLAPARSLQTYLDRFGFRPAVHLPSFAEIPPEVRRGPLPPPADLLPPTVGFLGRLERYKGIFDLLDAWPQVLAKVPSARLTIAGDGSSRAEVESIVRERSLGTTVVLRGWLDGAQKEEWFREIDLLAFPSNQWENLGFVALEALARGRPVVGTEIGGIPDVVEPGVSGRLVPIANPEALAVALAEMLLDRPGTAALGLMGRERTLTRFTPERHLSRLIEVYEAVIRGTPPPTGWKDL